jgi:hypothetical protein
MRARANTLLAAASVVACGAVLAQPPRTSMSPEQQLRQQIAELHTETGLARPAALVDLLRALAVVYQEENDHALASATLEEARYVARIHNGLTSAEEAVLLKQQIRSEKALGNDIDRRRFDLWPVAFALYERAYREFRQTGDVQASTEMLAPELPVTLPTYRRNPFASAATESPRYIDGSFDVTRYGFGERIEILDTTKDATREEKRDLIRLIESTSFRPRFVDGKLADAAPVALRYHLP